MSFGWSEALLVFLSLISSASFNASQAIDVSRFVDAPRFEQAKKYLDSACKERGVHGGIVNHHVLASDLIAREISEVVSCIPENGSLIIISPDHFLVSHTPVAVGNRAYSYQGQILQLDDKTLKKMEKQPFIGVQSDLFENEHGIGALVPFILGVRPDIHVVPVVVRRNITDEDLTDFSSVLASFSKQGSRLLVSSDMSHYLSERVALENDAQTLEALEKNNTLFFTMADDDFTDNGRSIAAVIRALGKPEWHLLDHSISSKIKSSPFYTTSYITGYWK